jgi:AcrR family transcriptional regulator
VNEEVPRDTRDRILRVAMDEFSAHGYHATSVREIAERVGVTKTAVLYHFPGKADIITALAEPLLEDLEQCLEVAERLDPDGARWIVLEGLLNVWLKHRYLLRLNLRDLGLAASPVAFDRFRDGMLRANALVAGPDADFQHQVRAAQAIAMLSDPVVLFADSALPELRDAVLDGVHSLFGERKSPRPVRGRPPKMTDSVFVTCQRLHERGFSASEIAAEVGVSRATVYRHLSPSH